MEQKDKESTPKEGNSDCPSPVGMSNPIKANILLSNEHSVDRAVYKQHKSLTTNTLKQFNQEQSCPMPNSQRSNSLSSGHSSQSDNKGLLDIDNDNQSVGVSSHNQKRYRRTKGEIPRKYTCWCGKAYGSENSLNQHKKLKNHFERQGTDEQQHSQMAEQ